jgi:hypothetical protein
MPHVFFTPHLSRHLDCPPMIVAGTTVREALNAVFAENPKLRGYILDDRSAVRQHVMIFLDGKPLTDRRHLSEPVREESEIYVMQALSGG